MTSDWILAIISELRTPSLPCTLDFSPVEIEEAVTDNYMYFYMYGYMV